MHDLYTRQFNYKCQVVVFVSVLTSTSVPPFHLSLSSFIKTSTPWIPIPHRAVDCVGMTHPFVCCPHRSPTDPHQRSNGMPHHYRCPGGRPIRPPPQTKPMQIRITLSQDPSRFPIFSSPSRSFTMRLWFPKGCPLSPTLHLGPGHLSGGYVIDSMFNPPNPSSYIRGFSRWFRVSHCITPLLVAVTRGLGFSSRLVCPERKDCTPGEHSQLPFAPPHL